MVIGKRNLGKVAGALFQKRHYKAFFKSFQIYNKPIKYIKDYIFASGDYPSNVVVKNNGFTISPKLYTSHDLLTVNEIFCREDYLAPKSIRTVLDLGANIGISALYFLTANKDSYVYLYEPNPENITKLKHNLENFKGRYTLEEMAVSDEEGILNFGVEDTGRYGGINVDTGSSIKVKCVHINSVLEPIIQKHGSVDIVKLDTEGAEIKTINGIAEKFHSHIQTIYFEEGDAANIKNLQPHVLKHFRLSNQGPIYKLQNNGVAKNESRF